MSYIDTKRKDYVQQYIPLVPKIFHRHIERCVKYLLTIDKKYDSIAFSGMSGAIMAPILGTRLNKHLIMVRKEKEHAHSCHTVEGYKKCDKYIIVDDLIDTGATVERIQEEIYKEYPAACCIGTLEYTKAMRLVKKSLLSTDAFYD